MSLSRLGWLCLALFALTSIAPGQQVGQPLQGPGIQAPIIADRDSGANLSATDAWYANHEMRLRSDGNLPGQLRSFDVAGNLTPVRARLFFIQNGQIIGRATADEHGRFQAVGLGGGPYSVVAASPEGFGAFSLRVLKNDGAPNVTPPKVKSIGKYKEASDVKVIANQPGGDPLMLDVSVIGPNDFPLIAQIIRDQVPGLSLPGGGAPLAPAGLGGGGAGVGGGGGGGFGGALGAAAAIGGVGALLGTSRTSNTASSSTGS